MSAGRPLLGAGAAAGHEVEFARFMEPERPTGSDAAPSSWSSRSSHQGASPGLQRPPGAQPHLIWTGKEAKRWLWGQGLTSSDFFLPVPGTHD